MPIGTSQSLTPTEKDLGTGRAAAEVRRTAPCRDPRSGVDFVLFAVFRRNGDLARLGPLSDRDARQHPAVIGGPYVSGIEVLAKDQLPVVGSAGA